MIVMIILIVVNINIIINDILMIMTNINIIINVYY